MSTQPCILISVHAHIRIRNTNETCPIYCIIHYLPFIYDRCVNTFLRAYMITMRFSNVFEALLLGEYVTFLKLLNTAIRSNVYPYEELDTSSVIVYEPI